MAVRGRSGALATLTVALAVAACSTGPMTPTGATGTTGPQTGPIPYTPSPNPTPLPAPSDALSPAVLPGWSQEDHLAAFRAYVDGCGAARDEAARRVCGRAKAMATTMTITPSQARAFFEASFSAIPAQTPDGRPGLLTSYFAPEYPARRRPDAEFSAPVLPKPANPRAAGDLSLIHISEPTRPY